MDFEWDPDKAASNFAKHGITFHEAATVFDDPLAMTYHDPDHSQDEDRFITFGQTSTGKSVSVVHVDRDDRTRIISAREMTRRERSQHEQLP